MASRTVSGTRYFKVKTVLIGDVGVGKTTFLNTFIHGKFIRDPSHKYRIVEPKEFVYEDRRICLEIWDTAGMERYSSLTTSYFRDARACVVFFDITDEETYAHVQGWLDDLWRNIPKNNPCCLFLVGTKRDQQPRDVSYERAGSFAEAHNMKYFETSAKDVDSVLNVFHMLLDHFEHEIKESTAAWRRKSQPVLCQSTSCDTSAKRPRCSC